jgi:hypothetical protein
VEFVLLAFLFSVRSIPPKHWQHPAQRLLWVLVLVVSVVRNLRV